MLHAAPMASKVCDETMTFVRGRARSRRRIVGGGIAVVCAALSVVVVLDEMGSGRRPAGPLSNYTQFISSSTQKYISGSTLLVSTGFLDNDTGHPVRIQRVRFAWANGCKVRMRSSGSLFNGLNGAGWTESADYPISRADFGRQYPLDRLTLRAQYGGGWFVSFNFQIPRGCLAATKGFYVTYETRGIDRD